ncbi:DUF1995 family protein [Gloeocapsa sp. PCC 73106]|uniref:DUF1995 family protein n=1 Tax=Gloeocapsa sp. PCC 73106 TaxID=102232 RepID=UPI0002ABE262|nr:DUF1995 family protein [Gloeocapsa sp. PCC 73106]ELR99216.1 protein of unknown function (DUF1995) [Gloeocapsa sp. PCC 73106]
MSVPQSLEEAIASAKSAVTNALNDGYRRLQVELVIPEIALQAQALALEFTTLFTEYGSGLKVFLPDTGAAALARRDWGETPFAVTDLGTNRSPIETRVNDTDQIFLVVSPSAVEVTQVEKLCNLAGDRPVVLLIPQLEDVSIVGIGLAARQLRERFLSTLESCYYFKPLEGAAVLKNYPSPWQVWRESGNDYQLLCEQGEKPLGEALERILTQQSESNTVPIPKKSGLLANLQQFLRALSQ